MSDMEKNRNVFQRQKIDSDKKKPKKTFLNA